MNFRRLDLINWFDGWLARARYGPLHRFTAEYTNGWTCHNTVQLLNSYGVRVWGRELYQERDEFAFLVKECQARWAQAVMLNRGIVINAGELEQGKVSAIRYKAWGVPVKRSLVDRLSGVIVKAVGA